MTEETRKAFGDFVFLANRTTLHPLDYERLYTFIHTAYQNGDEAEVTEGYISDALAEAGYNTDVSMEVSGIFRHITAYITHCGIRYH